jgi:hypothetical protein
MTMSYLIEWGTRFTGEREPRATHRVAVRRVLAACAGIHRAHQRGRALTRETRQRPRPDLATVYGASTVSGVPRHCVCSSLLGIAKLGTMRVGVRRAA